MTVKTKNSRINKKNTGKNRFRLRMCAAVLLFCMCVAFYSCGGEDNPVPASSAPGSATAAPKTSGASSEVSDPSDTGTSADTSLCSATESSTSSVIHTVTTADTTTSKAATTSKTPMTTSDERPTSTVSQGETQRNKYSDLPIYSPPVTDTVTFTSDGVKIYNSDFRLSSSLQAEFQTLKNNYPLSFTFTLRDLETEAIVAYNDAEKYRSASSIKGPYGLYEAKAIDAGKASLNDTVTFTQALYDPNGSGILTPADFGKTYTVKRLEYLMIHYSDNAGYFMLSSATGGKNGLNAMVKDIGCDEIIVGSPYWGRLTSREMGLVWREIYYYGHSGTAGGTRVYGLFEKAKYNDLQSYMGYKVVHKSGWGNKSFNDAGIVYYKDRHFVAVVFVERVNAFDETSAKGQFKKVCKFLVKVMKEYKDYCDKGMVPTPTQKITTTTAAPIVTTPTTEKPVPVTTKATEPPVVTTTTEATTTTKAAPTTTKAAPTTTKAVPTTTEEKITTTKAPPQTTTAAATQSEPGEDPAQ